MSVSTDKLSPLYDQKLMELQTSGPSGQENEETSESGESMKKQVD